MDKIILIALSVGLSIARLFVDTNPALTWDMASLAALNIVSGASLCGMIQPEAERGARWVWLILFGVIVVPLTFEAHLGSLGVTLMFMAGHHFVGMVLCLIALRNWRWPLGWICLSPPTLLELYLFLAARG